MKYSKISQNFAMSIFTVDVFFETCWTPCKKPHLSSWSRKRFTFFWSTPYQCHGDHTHMLSPSQPYHHLAKLLLAILIPHQSPVTTIFITILLSSPLTHVPLLTLSPTTNQYLSNRAPSGETSAHDLGRWLDGYCTFLARTHAHRSCTTDASVFLRRVVQNVTACDMTCTHAKTTKKTTQSREVMRANVFTLCVRRWRWRT